MSADSEGKRKKDRDPILSVGFVVLLLAFAGVIGIFVNDHYIKGDTGSPASTGSTVVVNYTGSYYGYYYDDGAEVFDTSLYSVASDEKYVKSFEFTLKSESQYATISFNPGVSTTYLQMFMNSVIGHKAGDKVTVCIDPTNGYGALTETQISEPISMSSEHSLSETITLDQFEKLYGFKITGNEQGIIGPYGWKVDAYLDGTAFVKIVHNVIVGETYKMNEDVSLKITGISGNAIEFDYVIDFEQTGVDFDSPNDAIVGYKNVKLVKVLIDNVEYYITAASFDAGGNATKFVTKNTDEKTGMYLYFVLEIVSVK